MILTDMAFMSKASLKDRLLIVLTKASKGKNWYGEEIKGREAINEYLKNDYSPSGVIDLAVVATMPYAKILEDGGGNLKQSYRVISMSFQKLQNLSKKYNGTVSVIRK